MAQSGETPLHQRAAAPLIRLESDARNDRIFPVTRWLAACIIPFLVVAFALLFFFPSDTDRYFAWTIRPTMTPMLMGAGYIAGAYFFVRVFGSAQWHRVTLGFPAVTAFASVMTLATVLHWSRFNHGHISFWVWTALYATTPFLVLAAWLNNRRVDPRAPTPGETLIPAMLRVAVGAAGIVNLATAVLLFLFPEFMLGIWPWQLTPLTGRVVSGWFALPGVVGLMVASDARWSAARVVLQSQMLGIALILVAVGRAWGEFNPSNPITWAFVGGLAALLLGLVGLYGSMERRRHKVTGH